MARSGNPDELFAALAEEALCFAATAYIPARLIERLAGPFEHPSGATGSVWRLVDAFGETEYVFLDDSSGPRQARGAAKK